MGQCASLSAARDQIFGKDFVDQVKALGIKQVLSAPRSPWQRVSMANCQISHGHPIKKSISRRIRHLVSILFTGQYCRCRKSHSGRTDDAIRRTQGTRSRNLVRDKSVLDPFLADQKGADKAWRNCRVVGPEYLPFDFRSGCSSFVTMMQSANYGNRYNPA